MSVKQMNFGNLQRFSTKAVQKNLSFNRSGFLKLTKLWKLQTIGIWTGERLAWHQARHWGQKEKKIGLLSARRYFSYFTPFWLFPHCGAWSQTRKRYCCSGGAPTPQVWRSDCHWVVHIIEASAKREWLVMNRKGPWEGYRWLSPSRLPLRAHFHRERDVWVRGRW